jgi:hypothetical protein
VKKRPLYTVVLSDVDTYTDGHVKVRLVDLTGEEVEGLRRHATPAGHWWLTVGMVNPPVASSRLPVPQHPYHWVINDTRTMIRGIAQDAGVRYQFGPHKDGDRGQTGFYVHFADLDKLAGFFEDTGQSAEAEWTREAKQRASEHS